jgi:hypothetical protein
LKIDLVLIKTESDYCSKSGFRSVTLISHPILSILKTSIILVFESPTELGGVGAVEQFLDGAVSGVAWPDISAAMGGSFI